MTLEAGIIVTILIAVAGAVYGYGQLNNRVDKAEASIGKFEIWKEDHTKESADIRLAFSKQISEISATLQVTQSQYAEILRRLDGIDKKLETRD